MILYKYLNLFLANYMRFSTRIQVLLCLILPLYAIAPWAQPGQIVNQPQQMFPPPQQMFAEPSKTPAPQGPKSLIIGVDSFVPPFVMQGGNGELYGYDISMMNSLCKILQRSCQFQIFKWVELIPAVMNNKVDLAVSSITITPERAKQMNFSLPYTLSYSRFLTNNDTPTTNPFSLNSLNGKKIGVYKGTIYEDQASHIGVTDPVIKTYEGYQDALKALTNKEIDYILLDNPAALYWAANSSGAFKAIGAPYVYGFGIAIVISETDKAMIPALNKALLQYQNSEDYRQNYHRFLESF